jgi:hypothetical protein
LDEGGFGMPIAYSSFLYRLYFDEQISKTARDNMKKYVGISLDHREAFVVSLTKDQPALSSNQEMIECIESDVEGRVRLSGGSHTRKTPYGPQEISVDSKAEDRFKMQIRQYYKQIMLRLGDADRIMIIGPGEAKIELKKELTKSKDLADRIKKIEAADKMTKRQIAAKVKTFFKPYL